MESRRVIKESRIQAAFEIETDYKYDLKRAKANEYSKQKKNLHYKTQNLFARYVKIKITINVNSIKNKEMQKSWTFPWSEIVRKKKKKKKKGKYKHRYKRVNANRTVLTSGTDNDSSSYESQSSSGTCSNDNQVKYVRRRMQKRKIFAMSRIDNQQYIMRVSGTSIFCTLKFQANFILKFTCILFLTLKQHLNKF